jgi:hypothetical protein
MPNEKTATAPETELISIKTLTPSKLFNVEVFRNNQKKLVQDNPIVQIVDDATYKKSDTSRKALKKGRTTLQNSKKIDIDEVKNIILTPLASTYDEITEITVSLEKEHEKACKDWEEKVAKEEKAKADAETLRKVNIQTKIKDFQDTWDETLSKLDFAGIEVAKKALATFDKTLDLEDYKEFQMEFSVKHQAITERLNASVKLLTENEEVKIENEKLNTYNARFETLVNLGSKTSDLGITLVNTSGTSTSSAFVSKESLKSMTAEAYDACLKKFNTVNERNIAKELADRTAKRTAELIVLGLIPNNDQEHYSYLLKDSVSLYVDFSFINESNDEDWNAKVKNCSYEIETDNLPTPEPIQKKVNDIAVVEPIIEAVPVVIPTENVIKHTPIDTNTSFAKIEKGFPVNTEFIPANTKVLTWDDIHKKYMKNSPIGEPVFLAWLKENYNPPTKKQ